VASSGGKGEKGKRGRIGKARKYLVFSSNIIIPIMLIISWLNKLT